MKSVLVNSLGYRQSETVWNPAEPGKNVMLTIDRAIQYTAERELAAALRTYEAQGGSIVVMDPSSGEILIASGSPERERTATVPRTAAASTAG